MPFTMDIGRLKDVQDWDDQTQEEEWHEVGAVGDSCQGKERALAKVKARLDRLFSAMGAVSAATVSPLPEMEDLCD